MSQIANIPPEKRGNPAWVKGGRSPNPSGRPRAIVEIEAMLDAEHRTVEGMRATFQRLKELAFGEPIDITDREGNVIRVELRAHPGFMKLYLDRLLGPESNDDKVKALAQQLLDGMLEEARARRQTEG